MSLRRVVLVALVLVLGVVAVPTAVSGQIGRQPTTAGDEGRGLSVGAGVPPADLADEGDDLDEAEAAFADQLISDDLVVRGSACLGLDCSVGTGFSYETLRLAENNLRIRVQDTSVSSAFPTQDWQLTFNDSVNGGLNRFSVEQVGPATATPLTIEAGANEDAVYVDDIGRLGLGLDNPATDVHVRSADTATIRLEQDASEGFAAQVWDLGANETNFFVRDITNASLLPFRIRPGAPTSSIDIAADGQVGIGTSSPDAALDIEADDRVDLRLTSTSGDNDWVVSTSPTGQADEGLSLSRDGSGATELRITPDGAMVVPDAPLPDATPGTIYFDGDTFCGYDGTAWVPLQATGDLTCS